MEKHCTSSATVVIDSLSLCEAFLGTDFELDALRKQLCDWPRPLSIQRVPGHCDIPGNEIADNAAKEASVLQGLFAPVHYTSIRCKINQLCRGEPSSHERNREVYSKLKRSTEMEISRRKDQTLLAKIRSGKTKLFRACENEIDQNANPMGPLRNDSLHTLEH